MNDIKLKAGDKVKSLVDFFGIRKGDIVTVTYAGFGYINVAEDNGSTLTNDEFEVFIQEEPSQMTIESLLKLAKEYAEKAAESQRKSEELYEEADKMYKELRGVAEEQVVEEDMSDPANWRVGDVVEFKGESIHMTKGDYYHLREYKHGEAVDNWGDVKVIDDEGDVRVMFSAYDFKWLSRPSKETK